MTARFAIPAAVVMLVAKAGTLLYMLFGTADHYRPPMFLTPLAYLAAAVWLWQQSRWARWPVGLFFLYASVHEGSVLFQGSTWELVRRPFSLGLAAWFAWAFLSGRGVPKPQKRTVPESVHA